MRIWKFTPTWSGVLLIPKGAKFRMFNFQYTKPCLWFELDKDADVEQRKFKIVGTGRKIPSKAIHLQSIQVEDKDNYLAWHLYEVPITSEE